MTSWNAKGRLSAHWAKVGGRDKLAALVGIQPSTLSGYNTGRLVLGTKNAKKVADALGVTIYDLGAPTEEQEAAGTVTVLERLDALEAGYAELRALLVERERPAVAAGDRPRERSPSERPGEPDRDPREDALPSLGSAEDRDVLP